MARLLGASDKIDRGRENDADVRLVLAPGTSLGGARPKATVRARDGRLMVAKFPKRDDDWPVTRWEATALTLARMAGISVPPFELHAVARKPVFSIATFAMAATIVAALMGASVDTGLLYINAIDWCTTFRLGKDPTWEATVPYTGLANGWGTNDPTDRWAERTGLCR